MSQAWPWFGSAAGVFVVAVGLFVALKPKPKRFLETAADAADKMGWTRTGRIDLADPQSVGALVLEVEETQISMSPTGVEHREIRWRRATLPEAKMVLEASTESRDVGHFHGYSSGWHQTKDKWASREHRD